MKFYFIAFLFSPSGEFLSKDILEVETQEVCEQTVQAYAKSIINTKNQASFFCLTQEEYEKN